MMGLKVYDARTSQEEPISDGMMRRLVIPGRRVSLPPQEEGKILTDSSPILNR
jgi:hypothetical protein